MIKLSVILYFKKHNGIYMPLKFILHTTGEVYECIIAEELPR